MTTALIDKIQTLNRCVWEHRLHKPDIDAWLSNFTGRVDDVTAEQSHALYLLSQYMYFGSNQIRQLIKAMFRDLYQYPILAKIRRSNQDTTDLKFLKTEFYRHLGSTRFLGLGNPSESGCHILYYFRQMNGLPKDLFMQAHEVLALKDDGTKAPLHFVFIDDFCGSGETALKAAAITQHLRQNHPLSRIDHFTLFACESGLDTVRSSGVFDEVEAVIELDQTFKCFSPDSRYFGNHAFPIKPDSVKATCAAYGAAINTGAELGFGDCQLLISFHHNTPDNTLPIFWQSSGNGCPWTPLFPRYPKLSYK